jgi:hypothetical protein
MAISVAGVRGATGVFQAGTVTSPSWTSTTGSTIVVICIHFTTAGASANGDCTDSKSNGYTLATSLLGGANAVGVSAYYNIGGTRGTSHTVTVNRVNSSQETTNLHVIEITSDGTISYDSASAATANDTTSPFTVTAAAAMQNNAIGIYGVVLSTGGTNAFTNPTDYVDIYEETDGANNTVSHASYKLNETGTPAVAASNTDTVDDAREIFISFYDDVSGGTEVDAGHASGTGTANDAVTSVDRAQAGHAAATGTANDATVSTGGGVSVNAGLAEGFGHAINPNRFAYIVQVSGAALSTDDPSVTFTGYTAKTNDLVILFVSSTTLLGAVANASLPAGWVNPLGDGAEINSDAHGMACFYHLVTSAEESGSTTTFTATNALDATETGYVQGVVVRNAEPTDPIDGSGTAQDSANTVTPHVLAAITGTGGVLLDHSLVISSVAKDGVGDYGTGAPAGWTWLRNDNTNNGRWIGIRQTRTTASTNVTATNITPSAGDEYASITVAVRQVIISMAAEQAAGTGTANAAAASLAPNAGTATATGAAFDVTVGGSATNAPAELASGTGVAEGASVKVSPNAGTATGSGTADTASVKVSPNAEQAAGTGAADTTSTKVSPNAGAAAGTGVAYGAIFQVFATAVSADGRYLEDQNGNPWLGNGISIQMIQNYQPGGAEINSLIATSESLGINLWQCIGNAKGAAMNAPEDGSDWDGNLPYTSGNYETPNSTYWVDTIREHIRACAVAGITVMFNPFDNISYGGDIGSEPDANMRTLGQELGNWFKDEPNLLWSIGNDWQDEQWSALNSKYGSLLRGIREGSGSGGASQPFTLWLQYLRSISTDNTDWDGTTDRGGYTYEYPDINGVYTYYTTEVEANRAWEADNIPVMFLESHYWQSRFHTVDGISTTTRKAVRKNAIRAICWGSLGGSIVSSDDLSLATDTADTDLTDVVFAHVARTIAHIASLDGWEGLVPDAAAAFVTTNADTEPPFGSVDTPPATGNDADTTDFTTAGITADGLLAVVYVTASGNTFALGELVGTPIHYWFDPTSGDTTAPTTGQPTYPGNNDAGDPDWLLVFLSQPPAEAESASGTGTANNASVNVAPNAGTAVSSGAADTASTKVSPNAGTATGTGAADTASDTVAPNAGTATGTGTGFDATVSTQSATNAPAGHAAATGAADNPSAALAVNAGSATGAGVAFDATVQITEPGEVLAGEGVGTGEAFQPSIKVTFGAGHASATALALDAGPSLAAVAEAATAIAVVAQVAAALGINAGHATGVGVGEGAEGPIQADLNPTTARPWREAAIRAWREPTIRPWRSN